MASEYSDGSDGFSLSVLLNRGIYQNRNTVPRGVCNFYDMLYIDDSLLQAVLLLITSCAIYFYPTTIVKEYNGTLYKLGDTNYFQDIKMSMDGNIAKGLFKGDQFEGTFYVGDKKLPKIKMRFDAADRTNLYYFEEGIGEFRAYGDFISKDMKQEFTILVFEKESNGSSWSSKDSYMISAPAESRIEALKISNKLLEDLLGGSLR
jgi:hypothetical protein